MKWKRLSKRSVSIAVCECNSVLRQGSFLYNAALYLSAFVILVAVVSIVIAVKRILNINFWLAVLITVLTVHFASKVIRRFRHRSDQARAQARTKAAFAKRLADNQAAKQPAMNDFARALGARKPGIALIRPFPPRNLSSIRSRIGGLPDLPKSIAWPRVASDSDRRVAKGGIPLHFLAQLDFSELPRVDARLPSSGILMFFAHLDEELGWSGSKNSVRAIFDPRSEGSRASPPSSITPVFDGRDDFHNDFGIEGDLCNTTLQEWPFIVAIVETIPGPAFSDSEALYPALLLQRSICETEYLVSQFDGKVSSQFSANVVHTSELGWTTGNANASGTTLTKLAFAEVFCHLRLCELLVRRLINLLNRYEQNALALISTGKALLDKLSHSNLNAAASHEHLENWVTEVVRAQISGVDVPQALKGALLQFVAECGSVVIDKTHIHEKNFAFAAAAHVLKRSDWGIHSSDDDESIAFFHQCLGHVWTAQGQPKDSDNALCLLHLKSDYGLGLLICDVGSIQFWITPKDLEAGDFSNVWATTQGH
jgi:uncharacterized protein YwqG